MRQRFLILILFLLPLPPLRLPAYATFLYEPLDLRLPPRLPIFADADALFSDYF